MMFQIDARKVQMLFSVLQRAPVMVAEGKTPPSQPPTGGADASDQRCTGRKSLPLRNSVHSNIAYVVPLVSVGSQMGDF
jgi:hypothetical protein